MENKIAGSVIEFELMRVLAKEKEGEPVDIFIVGATISQGEKRFIKQYTSNDYFTSYATKFGRPVNITDGAGISDMTKKLALLVSLATQVNRKSQVRDGIKPEIGPDVAQEFVVDSLNKITEGKVIPEKMVASIRAQLAQFRNITDAALNTATKSEPESVALPPENATKTTRKKKDQSEPTSQSGDMGMPVEEVN